MKIVAIIPARGGSKGINRKNIRIVGHRPLISYSIIQSLNSRKITNTYVSTEDEEIKRITRAYGIEIIDRPKHLATDKATTDEVLVHAAEYLHWDFDYMVLLQPTSPLRFAHQIDLAIKMIENTNYDSLLSVCINHKFIWSPDKELINFEKRMRRQELPLQYMENGSIYITKKEFLQKEGKRLGGKIMFYVMPYFQSFEIDEYPDIKIIEGVMRFYDFD